MFFVEMERSQTCSKKTERKIIEKNRRNHMKNLYSELNSLLPPHNHSSKEALSLPDQIDETVNHIKNVEAELQKLREKKQSLVGRKRWTDNNMTTLKSPKIEIRENGSNLEVVLISGLHVHNDSHFIFCEILRMLHEEGVDVFYSSFSVVGNSVFHTFHGQIGECMFGFGAAKVTERLKRYVNEFTSGGEMRPNSRELDQIYVDTWDQLQSL